MMLIRAHDERQDVRYGPLPAALGDHVNAAQSPVLRDAIASVLVRTPGLSARTIASELSTALGISVDKSTVNSCLYSDRDLFYSEGTSPPAWYARTASKSDAPGATAGARPSSPLVGDWPESLGLYPWQVKALNGWAKHGFRGVVEAVTGAGKTRLALAAIEAEMRRGGRAVAVVPTIELQNQWRDEIESRLIGAMGVRATVGVMGGGRIDTLQTSHILVATVQSACQYELGLPDAHGLLVADEVHHYGAEAWARALEKGFERRLGLTATYERDDDGVEQVLDPYFGPFRYSLGYEEALADRAIAHFKIAFVGVRFTADELGRYSEADDKVRSKRWRLIADYGLTPEPFGVFMREVVRLSKSGQDGARHAGMYLNAFTKRRQILAGAIGKFEYLSELAPAVVAADSTILFSQTRDAADEAVGVMAAAGVSGETLHAELDPSERRETFDAFRHGSSRFIAAPKLLDEGVDVPDADLAIVLASSRSRRQMIQRMGRVIRPKPDGRRARVAILNVEGTSEDPELGAHEDFVQFVTTAADDVRIFDAGADSESVVHYLNEW